MFGADFVRGRLQRAKQKFQPARPVRRNFLLLLGALVLRKRGGRYCADGRSEENCEPAASRGRESHGHGKSLDAVKPACKAARRQRPVMSENPETGVSGSAIRPRAPWSRAG